MEVEDLVKELDVDPQLAMPLMSLRFFLLFEFFSL